MSDEIDQDAMTDDWAAALAEQLSAALAPLGFEPDARPFRPHLTVLRNCRACDWAGEIEPVDWLVAGFELVRSETLPAGPRYEVIWPTNGHRGPEIAAAGPGRM